MSKVSARKTWVYILIGAIPSVALIGLTVYVLSRAISDMGVEGGGKRSTEICASRLKKVAQAHLLYAADHDGRLAPATVWVDATWSYAKVERLKDPEDDSESVFRCPVISARREGGYGYAFNSALDGEDLASVQDAEKTPLAFDATPTERNAFGKPEALMPSPEARHNGGLANVVAYVSGQTAVLYPNVGDGPRTEPSGLPK
jgi:hypothetical protein